MITNTFALQSKKTQILVKSHMVGYCIIHKLTISLTIISSHFINRFFHFSNQEPETLAVYCSVLLEKKQKLKQLSIQSNTFTILQLDTL